MNIGRSFRFAFRTPRALRKLVAGGLFSVFFFAVFPAFAVFGYLTRLMCDLLEGRDTKLPEWDDLTALFQEGLQPVLILLVYASPFVGLSILGLYVPSYPLYLFQLLVLLAVSVLLPVALIHLVTTGSILRALHLPSKLSYLKANFRRFVIAWAIHVMLTLAAMVISGAIWILVAVPASSVLSGRLGIVVGLVTGMGTLCFFSFVISVITSHLFAQAYRASEPFEDDVEGAVRASIVMPPSLKNRK